MSLTESSPIRQAWQALPVGALRRNRAMGQSGRQKGIASTCPKKSYRRQSGGHCISLSGITLDRMVSFDQQKAGDSSVTIVKPEAVHEYNRHRSGVDTVDQLRGNYAMGRKSMKNWLSSMVADRHVHR